MNIAITGQKGLIGSFLKERLEKEGNRIVLEIDSRDGENIRGLKDKKVDFKIDLMIHAAAHCKINQSITIPEKTFEDNVKGTFAVFEFCRKNNIPRIVYFSSSRVLNKERNPYTASKLYGEELCKAYKNSYGIDYLIIRPSTVYGPVWDETQRLMHIFIVNALENKDLIIYGDPETKTLDFTYVEDFIDGIMLTIGDGWNKEYNISGNQEFKVFDLAKMIINLTESKSKIVIKDPEIAQPQEVSVDISRIKYLGYSPKTDLEKGLKKTIEYYKNHLKK
jgi:nucleoside-diphosphate-sugar epimerase